MTAHWHFETAQDGTLWLGLDYAGGSVNLLASEVLDELDGHLGEIEGGPPSALVLHSRKRGFIAGADLNELDGTADIDALERHIERVHTLLARFEALPCPSVAMIDGYCLGGGLELALACRYRVASDGTDVRLGFPEVRLGIFPGYGGTWRAIRNIGALPAMRLMLTGRTLSAREARRVGLVDMVVPQRQLRAAPRHILKQRPPPRRASQLQRLPSRPLLRPLVVAVLRRRTARQVNPAHYPAPFRLIEHWRAYGEKGPALLAAEAQEVSRLLTSDTAGNLIRLFKLRERLKGLGRGRAHGIGRVHVIGAGAMGGDVRLSRDAAGPRDGAIGPGDAAR